MGNASQINRSRNSVRVERRSDLNESDLGEVYCIKFLIIFCVKKPKKCDISDFLGWKNIHNVLIDAWPLVTHEWSPVSILGFENCQSFFSYNCPCTYGVPQCAAHRNARRAPVWLSQHLPNSQNSCGTSHTDNCLINTPYCHACF